MVGFIVERLWIDVAIIGPIGLAMGLFFRWTPKSVRLAEELLRDLPARGVPLTDQVRLDREKAEALTLSHGAKPVPLTNEIRLDREEVYDVLDRMRAALAE